MSQRRELLEPEPASVVILVALVVVVLVLSGVMVVMATVLDTGEGFRHGRSGFILSTPSGLLHTNSNEPMRWPGLHILFECRNACASNEGGPPGMACVSATGIEDNDDT